MFSLMVDWIGAYSGHMIAGSAATASAGAGAGR